MLWTGEMEEVEAEAGRFAAHTVSHSLTHHLALGRGFMGELAIRRRDPRSRVAGAAQLPSMSCSRHGTDCAV